MIIGVLQDNILKKVKLKNVTLIHCYMLLVDSWVRNVIPRWVLFWELIGFWRAFSTHGTFECITKRGSQIYLTKKLRDPISVLF
jgi:hypothetical protein